MKKINIIYWIVTILFAVFMILTAIPDVLLSPDATVFMRGLGYPDYMTRFIGIAKVLGCIAIVIPGPGRIKEWAYAGLFFDLAGAIYSIFSVGGFQPSSCLMFVFLAFFFAAYFLWRKKIKSAA